MGSLPNEKDKEGYVLRRFRYYAPATLEEAVSLLGELGDGGKLIAGGTDLLVQMRERGLHPPYLVSLKNFSQLRGIGVQADGGLRIGALTYLRDLERSEVIRQRFDIIAQAASLIGSVQIRNTATVGGNLCNAAPSADMAPPLIALEAEAVIFGPGGERRVLLEEFFLGPGRTVLATNEILAAILVPPPLPHSAGTYLRHTPRQQMDIAVVGVGAVLQVEPESRRCQVARIALGAVAPTPIRAKGAEAVLTGQAITDELIEEAAQRAVQECRPISDVRASAQFRRWLVRVLTRRAVSSALAKIS